MKKRFIVAKLIANIFINIILYREKKYDKVMSKAIVIIFKLISDQHQPIIEGKTHQEV